MSVQESIKEWMFVPWREINKKSIRAFGSVQEGLMRVKKVRVVIYCFEKNKKEECECIW